MAIKEVFAQNLRALCKARGGSINAICRGLGIGRTQMDRYLKGEHLPNELNLRKISEFFAVEDIVLFSAGGPAGQLEHGGEASDARCKAIVARAVAAGPSALAEGNYQTFFLLASNGDQAMLSLTLVRRRGQKTVFRRLTRFTEDPALAAMGYQGRHDGIVIDKFDAHYFIGVNQVGSGEPSLMLMHELPVDQRLLGGRALLLGDRGPAASPVVMRFLPPETSLLSAIRQIGVADINSPQVGPLASQFLRRPYF